MNKRCIAIKNIRFVAKNYEFYEGCNCFCKKK